VTYQEFKEEVKKNIIMYLPYSEMDVTVSLEEFVKINDQKTSALCIGIRGSNVIPRIQLDSFYRMYTDGADMKTVMRQIAHTYVESEKVQHEIVHAIYNSYDSVKKSLYMVAMNKDSNLEYLKGVCHEDVPGTDITLAVRVLYGVISDKQYGSFLVQDRMIEKWGVDRNQVLTTAYRNTGSLFPPELKSMQEVMTSLGMFEDGVDESECFGKLRPFEQYVLTNNANLYGATVMFYPQILKDISQKTEANIYILPSSVHEVLLIKDNGDMSAEELQQMVMDVNRECLEPGEVLSDEVYCYDYKEQRLFMATNRAHTKELVQQLEGSGGVHSRAEWSAEADGEIDMEQ
jgi:hypothetical protein